MKTKTQQVSVALDDACHELLRRTAARTRLNIQTLLDLSVESFIGSLEGYGLSVPTTDRKAPKGQGYEKRSVMSKDLHSRLNEVGVFLNVPVSTMIRDAVLGQRFNFQRLQPVNARAMGSVRQTLFKLEQQPAAA
tara:strand:+ start:325 stop:729 length:405 start_codon:yes stop_codon:yes gene_type:complete